MDPIVPVITIILAAVAVVLLLILLLRPRAGQGLGERLDALRGDSERVERTLREEQRAGRAELAKAFAQFRAQVDGQLRAASVSQRERIDEFSKRLTQLSERTDRSGESLRNQLLEDARKAREEHRASLAQFSTHLQESLKTLAADSQQRLAEVRGTLDAQLKSLQADNAQQLEKMRATVDEKLQATLNARLTASFKQVIDNLTAVQQGLGEMRSLATGVGDLKRVLTNVKTRGTFGEVGLHALLEDLLTPEQYGANVATIPGSHDHVEFAVRLPGPDGDAPVWLPIDAKFPREDFERLRDAQEQADAAGETTARTALARRIDAEAGDIREKYVQPPHTTDFAILYLATESLYAEALRQPGLFESIQRQHHVTLAGPTTLTAILNALQMGFRTLAIERRSSEVWRVLGTVKGEFEKFGDMLDSAIKQVDTVRNTLKRATGKTTTIGRKLRDVQSLPAPDAEALPAADATGPTGEGLPDDAAGPDARHLR